MFSKNFKKKGNEAVVQHSVLECESCKIFLENLKKV